MHYGLSENNLLSKIYFHLRNIHKIFGRQNSFYC